MVVTRQVTPEINMARDASRIGMLPSRAPPVEISPPATANTMAARPAITNPIRYDRRSQVIDSSLHDTGRI
jgi:septal ring-binding cell division protein DamX